MRRQNHRPSKGSVSAGHAADQTETIRRLKHELEEVRCQRNRLESEQRNLQQLYAGLRQREAGFDRSQTAQRKAGGKLKQEIARLEGLLAVSQRRLNRDNRLIAKLRDANLQLQFLLQGTIYVPPLAYLLRKLRIKWSGGRRRNNNWQRVVDRRARLIGGKHCEVCGASNVPILGHHIIAHADGGPDSVENCQLRCEPCEQRYHQLEQPEG